MIEFSVAKRLRERLREQLKESPSASQKEMLLRTIHEAENSDTAEGTLKGAFARILLIQIRGFDGASEGLGILRQAHKTLSIFAESNRRLKVFVKDCFISLGNLQAENSDWQQAIESYDHAIRGEKDYDRAAIGQLNKARALLANGNIYEALRIAEKVDISRLESQRMCLYFKLLRARILLILGYERLTCEILQAGEELPDVPIALEWKYLTLMAQIDFVRPGDFLVLWSQFREWTVSQCPAHVQYFYELEEKIYRTLIEPASVRNKENYLARARYLADKVNERPLLNLLRVLISFFQSETKQPTEFSELITGLQPLTIAGNYRMFQTVVMILGSNLLELKQYRNLADLLAFFAIHQEKTRARLPKQILKRLAVDENRVQNRMEQLLQSLPEVFRSVDDRIESFLLKRDS